MDKKKKSEPVDYEVFDVEEDTKGLYCLCLEDWSDEMKEAGNRKSLWYDQMKNRGLGAKMIKGSDGVISGMIQYVPAEYAPLTGENFYFIYCVWVHGHKKGIGDKRGRGMG
uniref:hypothetical protein n=1 Tax=Oceanispirochaeta sp. TaxID=2035350 RepID=UPI00261F8F79